MRSNEITTFKKCRVWLTGHALAIPDLHNNISCDIIMWGQLRTVLSSIYDKQNTMQSLKTAEQKPKQDADLTLILTNEADCVTGWTVWRPVLWGITMNLNVIKLSELKPEFHGSALLYKHSYKQRHLLIFVTWTVKFSVQKGPTLTHSFYKASCKSTLLFWFDWLWQVRSTRIKSQYISCAKNEISMFRVQMLLESIELY